MHTALPTRYEYRDQLVRELTAVGHAPNAERKIQIESKAAIKVKLGGASPDYADALAMAVVSSGAVDFATDLSERGAAVAF